VTICWGSMAVAVAVAVRRGLSICGVHNVYEKLVAFECDFLDSRI
jgi:hypothetical protein